MGQTASGMKNQIENKYSGTKTHWMEQTLNRTKIGWDKQQVGKQ